MKKLTEVTYWDRFHVRSRHFKQGVFARLKKILKDIFGLPVTNYSQHLFYETILRKYVASMPKGSTIFELGSAPGGNLLGMWQRYGLEPYGVEYSEEGLEENRRNFKVFGLDGSRIYQADIFDLEFQALHREEFDVVFSRGLIEHFDRPEESVAVHLQFLRKGGLLFVVIPNLRGIHWLFTWFFHRESLAHHNLSLMKLRNFEKVFSDDHLLKKECGYYGTFNFGLYNPKGRVRMLIHRFLMYVQNVLDLVFHLVLRGRGVESAWSSPYLYYIGIKK